MIKRHLRGILNAIVLGITNARSEGINSRIQWIKYSARGYRNRDRFRTSIYFHLGGLDLYPNFRQSRTMDKDTAGKALAKISALFSISFQELEGSFLLGELGEAKRHHREFAGDLVGLESFVNHFHLEDAVEGLPLDPRSKRRHLNTLGEALIRVWTERFTGALGDRKLLFYLGGPDDVTVRFHVERAEAPSWMSLDPEYAHQQRMRVYRAANGKVKRIV